MGSAEERKPWYRRFEVVFPLAALIVIIVLFVVVFALRDDLFGEEKPRGIGDFPELEEYWEGLCQKDNLTIESVMSAPDGVTTFFECNDSEDNWYILYPMNDDAMSLENMISQNTWISSQEAFTLWILRQTEARSIWLHIVMRICSASVAVCILTCMNLRKSSI